jgi:hypothetical protein
MVTSMTAYILIYSHANCNGDNIIIVSCYLDFIFSIYVSVWRWVFLWDTVPCSLIDTDRRFRGTYCLHDQADSSAIVIVFTVRTSDLTSIAVLYRNLFGFSPVFYMCSSEQMDP